MDSYQEKLEREKHWYTEQESPQGHFLNSWPFHSEKRNDFSYVLPKVQMARAVERVIPKFSRPKILIAPLGTGDDFQYVAHLSDAITGLDISPEAVVQAPQSIRKYVGDMKHMSMLPQDSFDVVISTFFYHHYLRFGFDAFLNEALRVLKPAGHFFCLEPNSLHPVCYITWVGVKMFGNVSGRIDGEAPFIPFRLSGAMRRCGFTNIAISAASFSHNRLPVWMAKANNFLTRPFLEMPVLKYFAWVCLFYGRKPVA